MTALLSDRVAALAGPDYAIELEIATWCYQNGAIAGVNYDPRLWMERNGGDFTSSLDAAMTLVPKGHDLAMAVIGNKAFCGFGQFDKASDDDVEAATPALALCAAALKARGL